MNEILEVFLEKLLLIFHGSSRKSRDHTKIGLLIYLFSPPLHIFSVG